MVHAKGADAIRALGKRFQQTGKFVKLENDGDFIECVFLGEPEAFGTIWDDEGKTRFLFDEKTDNESEASTVVLWNVWDLNAKRVRIWQRVGLIFFNYWCLNRDEQGMARFWKLKRSGKKNDKQTQYFLFPGKSLSQQWVDFLAQKVEPFILKNEIQRRPPAGSSGPGRSSRNPANAPPLSLEDSPSLDTSDGMISEETAAKLAKEANMLDLQRLTKLLDGLSIQSLGMLPTLPASKEQEILKLIRTLKATPPTDKSIFVKPPLEQSNQKHPLMVTNNEASEPEELGDNNAQKTLESRSGFTPPDGEIDPFSESFDNPRQLLDDPS